MQIYLFFRYPRTISEIKKIISEMDQVWLQIIKSPRGRERSRNYVKLMQMVGHLHDLSIKKAESDPTQKHFHHQFELTIEKWAKRRRMPIL